MTDSQSVLHCELEVDLSLERFDRGGSVQSVGVSAGADGTLRVSSTGQPARVTLRQIRQAGKAFRAIAEATGQDIIIEHDGRKLAQLHARTPGSAKWTIHWWSIFRQWIKSK